MRAQGWGFVAHVASRYLRATRASGRIASSALSILGVASGVMTLVAVTGVMNGFQLGFIEDILEVSSYHLQLQGDRALSGDTVRALRSLPGVTGVVAFTDNQGVLDSSGADMKGCLVRGIEVDAPAQDRGFAGYVSWLEGGFSLTPPRSIALGVELARSLGVGVGDRVRLLALSTTGGGGAAATWEALEVTGVFRTGYYDFDAGMSFVSLATAAEIFSGGAPAPPVYGVKLASRFDDAAAADRVRAALGAEADGFRVTSWREFNRAFFSALLLEKVLMLTLPGLIFVVVAFSIYHSLKRTVYERREEIALLAALGAKRSALRAIFVAEGALIGLGGGIPGLLAGLLVSANVNGVFRLVEAVVNGVLGAAELLASPVLARGGETFSIFSPTFFYLSEVPSRVLLPEALGITIAGVLSAAVAALLASRRFVDASPAEVLRYE